MCARHDAIAATDAIDEAAPSIKLDRSYKCAQDPPPNLLPRDRAAAAAAAAVLLVRALDGLASFFALASFLILAEVHAARVLGARARMILVELPEHPVWTSKSTCASIRGVSWSERGAALWIRSIVSLGGRGRVWAENIETRVHARSRPASASRPRSPPGARSRRVIRVNLRSPCS